MPQDYGPIAQLLTEARMFYVKCPTCTKHFVPDTWSQLFCSTPCRQYSAFSGQRRELIQKRKAFLMAQFAIWEATKAPKWVPCDTCGEPMLVKHVGRTKRRICHICSAKARKRQKAEAAERRKAAPPIGEARCAQCGKPFPVSNPRHPRLYCTPSCRKDAQQGKPNYTMIDKAALEPCKGFAANSRKDKPCCQ